MRVEALSDRLVTALKLLSSELLIDCPYCCSTRTTQLQRTTDLGYTLFRCKACHRTFNEWTGTPFNFIEVPTDIMFQVLLCRFRYKLSFRNIAEFFLLRGFEFSHETVRDWEERFAPIFAERLRAKRQGKVGKIWFSESGADNNKETASNAT